jgi:hydrogenase maturation protease
MLYPYRASAVKNQRRWNFGVLCPRSYSEQQGGSEAWMMQTECLIEGGASAKITVRIRFLQIVSRKVGRFLTPVRELSQDEVPEYELVDRLVAGDQTLIPWEEAVERQVTFAPTTPPVQSRALRHLFEFPTGREVEGILDENGMVAGVLIRESEKIAGLVEIDFCEYRDGVTKVTVRISNLTDYEASTTNTRSDALMYSLVSTHTILGAESGQFVSLLDPPQDLSDLAAGCKNVGAWPVLVGENEARDTMLSSPIILYDYPEIAPESPGSLFDGTEIDEILSLRILTMTDEEKHEMRQSDQRARQILDRTESMPPEQFMKLHGALRGLHPSIKEAK